MVSSLRQTKAIKTLSTGIAWASVLIDRQPIHLISVYLAPQEPKSTNETIDRLLIALDGVLSKLPSSKFILAGDLTEQRPHVQSKLRARGLLSAIPDGHATHSAGNQLDQIFANFAVDVEQLTKGTVDSDHASFLITASITKEQHDVDLQHLPRQVRQQDVRALANDEATVQALLRQGSVLDLPTQNLYQDCLQAKRRMVRWYEAPRRLPGREAPIKVGFDQTTL